MSEPLSLTKDQAVADDRTLFGFWTYIMTDCVLFASLFATYAVLHTSTFGGPGPKQLFSLPNVLAETLILLTSSFTMGLAMLAVHQRRSVRTQWWLAITFVLGIVFLLLEINEFHHLILDGNSWTRSGFLSAFFVLVATHGLHITIGLIWMTALRFKVWRGGFTRATVRRLTMMSMFWHFLDVVWIFIFTIVYMMGAV